MSITVLSSILAFNNNESLCAPELNPDPPMRIQVFALICFIILTISNTFSLLNLGNCFICSRFGIPMEKRKYYAGLGNGVYMGVLGVMTLFFSILGFMIYSQSTEQCKSSGIGRDLQAFCVLSVTYCPCLCCVGALGIWGAGQKRERDMTTQKMMDRLLE